MSLNNAVLNKRLVAVAKRWLSTLSPTSIEKASNTVPAEIRCKPSTRISLTTNDSAAENWLNAAKIQVKNKARICDSIPK